MDDNLRKRLETVIMNAGLSEEDRARFLGVIESLEPAKREEVAEVMLASPRLAGAIWEAAQGKAAIAAGEDTDIDGFVAKEMASFSDALGEIGEA